MVFISEEKIQPFDSFSIVYKVLIWTGFFKLLNKTKFNWICHEIYRLIVFSMAVIYNLQHIIFIIQRRDNIEDVFDALIIEVPQLNLLVKFLTLNLQIPRIIKINKLINEPVFAANSKKDEELLLKNKTDMHNMFKFVLLCLSIAAFFWPASCFWRRYLDPNAVVPSYVPFETDTWGKFSISVLIEVLLILWVAYGQIAIDAVIATYYAQAEIQLKIIKYNIEHLFDTKHVDSNEDFQYKDMIDRELKGRFVYYMQRFEKLAWYTKEIDEIFKPAISFQFLTSSMSLCMVVYKMTSTPIISVPFIFLIVLILIFLTQVFLYCYFGNSVQYESESLAQSLYLSDWVSVSPKFRRLILIAMIRWSRILTPTVSGMVPLSLQTFVSILRFAYSLFAVLGTVNDN